MRDNTTSLIFNYIYKDNVFIFLYKGNLYGYKQLFQSAVYDLSKIHFKHSNGKIYWKYVYQTKWILFSDKKLHRNNCLKYII